MVVVLPCVALMNNFISDMQISNQTVLLRVFLCMCTMSCLAWFACTVTNSKILPFLIAGGGGGYIVECLNLKFF